MKNLSNIFLQIALLVCLSVMTVPLFAQEQLSEAIYDYGDYGDAYYVKVKIHFTNLGSTPNSTL